MINKFFFFISRAPFLKRVPDRANKLKTFVLLREAIIYGFFDFVDGFLLGARIKKTRIKKKVQEKLEREYNYENLKLIYPTWYPLVNYFDVENDS